MKKTSPGHRLREWRKRRGLSIKRAAAEIRCHHTHISAYELGKRTPTPAVRARIRSATGIPADAWAASGVCYAERAWRVLQALMTSRRFLRTSEIATACGLGSGARALLHRLEDSGLLISYHERGLTSRWGLAVHVVACPRCKSPFAKHHVATSEGRPLRYTWECPPPNHKRA